MLSPFLVPSHSQENPYPIPLPSASMRVFLHPLTHSCLTALASPYTGASSLHRTKGLSFHDILQGHPLLHMQLKQWVAPCVLFVWWFSSGELWGKGSGWLILLFFLWGSFSPFSNSSIGDHMISSMVGCKQLPQYMLGSGRASQENYISLLSACNSWHP